MNININMYFKVYNSDSEYCVECQQPIGSTLQFGLCENFPRVY